MDRTGQAVKVTRIMISGIVRTYSYLDNKVYNWNWRRTNDPFFSVGALDLTRSSLNTTHRVYFYVIVKMWFTLPINEGRMVFTDRLIAMGARIERLSK